MTGDRFQILKGKFLFVSYGEASIYALSINKTGNITEEIAIRLPDIQGHLISTAKSPAGEIYIGGEKIIN